jgi:hypothetical protein
MRIHSKSRGASEIERGRQSPGHDASGATTTRKHEARVSLLGRFNGRVDGPVLICRRAEPERSSIDVLFLLS